MPIFRVRVEKGILREVAVVRGAPCGATWPAARSVLETPAADAPVRMGLSAQMFCVADPSGWDPISGRSPVHLAGELHSSALTLALKAAGYL